MAVGFLNPSPIPQTETVLASGSFSAVTAVNLSNVLSNTYTFYRLYVTAYCFTSNQILALRFRENSTDITTAYYGASFYTDYTGATGSWQSKNNGTSMSIGELFTSANNWTSSVTHITRPGADNGIINHLSYGVPGSAGFFGGYNRSGMTNFNGLTFFPLAQTMTGRYILTGIK